MKLEVGRYGSTFTAGCYQWRVPPGKRPRLVRRGRWSGKLRERPVPWWIALRMDESALAGLRGSGGQADA